MTCTTYSRERLLKEPGLWMKHSGSHYTFNFDKETFTFYEDAPNDEPKKYGLKYDATFDYADQESIDDDITVPGYRITQEIIDDDLYNHYSTNTTDWIVKEPTMQVYDYVIVRTNKKGETREILEYDRILAQTEEKAKLTALAQHIQIQGEDLEVDLDRLEVLVRPF